MDYIKGQKLCDAIWGCSLIESKTYFIIENEFRHKPAKARVTGPASLSCISKSSMLAVGSLKVGKSQKVFSSCPRPQKNRINLSLFPKP